MPTIYDQLYSAFDQIDFEESERIAAALDLQYVGREKPPTAYELKNLCRSLILQAENTFYENEKKGCPERVISVMSGCWHVFVLTWPSGTRVVRIIFGKWKESTI
jgi:hypothetical protein